MKALIVLLLLAAISSAEAQLAISPYRALRPIMKDPNNRNAPTSLNQMPSESAAQPAPAAPVRPAQPAVVIARIEVGLAPSKISLIGTVDGLKGRLYVTNLSSRTVAPLARFVVCNQNGFPIGISSKAGADLSPGDVERLEVIATNLGAVDLKLAALTSRPAGK